MDALNSSWFGKPWQPSRQLARLRQAIHCSQEGGRGMQSDFRGPVRRLLYVYGSSLCAAAMIQGALEVMEPPALLWRRSSRKGCSRRRGSVNPMVLAAEAILPAVVRVEVCPSTDRPRTDRRQKGAQPRYRDKDGQSMWDEPMDEPRSKRSQGSGVLVRPIKHNREVFVVTNAHVVGSAATAQVVLSDGTRCAARVLGVDPHVDIAVLRVLDHQTSSGSPPLEQGSWLRHEAAGRASHRPGRGDSTAGPVEAYLTALSEAVASVSNHILRGMDGGLSKKARLPFAACDPVDVRHASWHASANGQQGAGVVAAAPPWWRWHPVVRDGFHPVLAIGSPAGMDGSVTHGALCFGGASSTSTRRSRDISVLSPHRTDLHGNLPVSEPSWLHGLAVGIDGMAGGVCNRIADGWNQLLAAVTASGAAIVTRDAGSHRPTLRRKSFVWDGANDSSHRRRLQVDASVTSSTHASPWGSGASSRRRSRSGGGNGGSWYTGHPRTSEHESRDVDGRETSSPPPSTGMEAWGDVQQAQHRHRQQVQNRNQLRSEIEAAAYSGAARHFVLAEGGHLHVDVDAARAMWQPFSTSLCSQGGARGDGYGEAPWGHPGEAFQGAGMPRGSHGGKGSGHGGGGSFPSPHDYHPPVVPHGLSYSHGLSHSHALSYSHGHPVVASHGHAGALLCASASIAPGSSGGALVDASGRLIGILKATHATQPGICFAIPIATALASAAAIIAQQRPPPSCYLGVSLATCSAGAARHNNRHTAARWCAPEQPGALLTSVDATGPAAAAGARAGDLVVRCGGVPVASAEELLSISARWRVGDYLMMDVVRGGGQNVMLLPRVGDGSAVTSRAPGRM
eukprot:jgi/Mesvir1/25090/Mv21556-RA.1